MKAPLTPRQATLLRLSRPDRRDGQGLPVRLLGIDFTVARNLERRGLGWIDGTRANARFCANTNGVKLARAA